MHRGPQAHSAAMAQQPAFAQAPAPAYAYHAPNAALLIDFDNVTMGIRSDLGNELRNLLGSDIIKGKVAVQRAYADWRRYPQYIVPLTESSIDMIFAPAYGSSKKNATDIRLAVDAMELVFTRPEIGTYILLSGDSDFSSLVLKLKEYGKYVIGVGIRESSSDLLVMNCDEYYSYNALAGLVKSNEEESVSRDPWELVTEALARMQRNGDVMRSDRLKQVMQEIDASFDEGDLGFSKFSKFTLEAAQKGLLTITRLENGQLEVGPGGGSPVAAVTDGARPIVRAPRERETESEDRPGRPRRSRRGRGGRGRDARPAGEATVTGEHDAIADVSAQGDEAIAEATTAEFEVLESAPTEASGAERQSADRPRLERPRRDEHVQRVLVTDAVGQTGERLTRDEAFDLVRRAVESMTQNEGDAVRAGALRERARELLGRDSESLGDRMFTRILRDAHDGDVIDLRRRGDDFEVARAAAVPSVRDQLARAAETAAAPASTAAALSGAAAARRGMGPRGVPAGRGGRGSRGRSGPAGPPPDLFVGMIEEPVAPIGLGTHSVEEIAEVVPEPESAEPEAPKKLRPRGGAKRGATRKSASTNGADASKDASAKKPRPRARKTAAKETDE
jgi:uncharacterized protein (TIGR00288 family)